MDINALIETNQRLNRRCQALEKELAKRDRADAHCLNEFRCSTARVHTYAGRLRDEWRESQSSTNAFYRQHYERLPKPPGWQDGIQARVDYVLKLLEELPQ